MSWLQDLAGKAENLLNKIDQNAATVLQQSSSSKSDNDADSSLQTGTAAASDVPPMSSSVTLDIPLKRIHTSQSVSSLQSSTSTPSASPKPMPKALSLRGSPSSPRVVVKHSIAKPTPADDTISLASSRSSEEQLVVVVVDEKSPAISMSQAASSSRASSVSSVSSKQQTDTITSSITEDKLSTTPPPAGDAEADDVPIRHEMSALKIVLTAIQAERDEANAKAVQMQTDLNALQQVDSRAATLELESQNAVLQADCEAFRVRLAELGESNTTHLHTIADLEHRLQRSACTDQALRTQADLAQREADQAAVELQTYRARAQDILRMKDLEIERLKQAENSGAIVGRTAAVPEDEIELLRRDNERLKSAAFGQKLRMSSALEASSLEAKALRNERSQLVDQLQAIGEDHAKQVEHLELEKRALKAEIETVRREMAQQQLIATATVVAKDELIKQRSQQAVRPPTSSSSSIAHDFEGRIHSLTQSLVHKQNSLESVTADRNALRFQLERVEQEFRVAMSAPHHRPPSASSTSISSINDTDDVKARLPLFVRETPFDTRVSRRMKRAYSSLDAVGVRVGGLLRRYPLIRILAIFYVVLLHLWVMVVLFTSTPN